MSCFHFDLPLSIAHLHLARCRVKCGYKFDYKTACCQLNINMWKIKTINKEYIMKKNGTSLSGNPLSKPHRASHLTLLCRSYIWYMPTTQWIFDLNLIEVRSK